MIKRDTRKGLENKKNNRNGAHTRIRDCSRAANSLQTSEDGFLVVGASACQDGTNTRTNDDGTRDVMEGS